MFAEFAPIEPLEGVVASIWLMRESRARVHTLWADLHSDLLIVIDGRLTTTSAGRRVRIPPVCFLGAHDRTLSLESDGPLSMIGVQLEPWAARRFLRVPPKSVAGVIRDYADVWNNPVPLRHWMVDAPESERVSRLQGYLYVAAGPRVRDDKVESALRRVYRKRGDIPVDDLAESADLNVRALQRAFQDAVGLSPKRCVDVVRFNYARHRLMLNSRMPLSRIAAQCGYADQAHFSRAFRRFFGLTPRQVQQSGKGVANRVR